MFIKRPEACALCLAVALQHSNEPRIYEWATHAFFIYSGEPEIKKRTSSLNYSSNPNSGISNVQYQQTQNQLPFSSYAQPQSFHQQYQQYNPHSSLISESGAEPPETSMYADMTVVNQPYRNKPNFTSMSYINSPQQMSTPITMRTKEQLNATYQQTQPQGTSYLKIIRFFVLLSRILFITK